MIKVALFSPAAGGNVGHGFIYALKLGGSLQRTNDLTLFTINDPKRVKAFKEAGINVMLSKIFIPGLINKKRFNKFRIFAEPLYGIYRIYYNYLLLKEFYSRNRNSAIYHLLEFEYSALIIYSLFNRKIIEKTVIGMHIADFKWIKGRSAIVNIYKSVLNRPVSKLLKVAGHTTTHGEVLRKLLIENLSVSPDRISSVHYGCDVISPIMTKLEARKIIGIENDKRLIALFFGVIRSDKGLIEVLKSFNKISQDILLLIAGSEGDIKKSSILDIIRIENLNDRVHTVIKYFEEEEIKYYFYAADFVLITHKRNHLAFSGPLSLAVEHCRPVIASNVGEIGAFVTKNSIGELFKHDNWDDFISVINDFTTKYSFYDDVKFNRVQKENSWEDMSNRINDVYKLIKYVE